MSSGFDVSYSVVEFIPFQLSQNHQFTTDDLLTKDNIDIECSQIPSQKFLSITISTNKVVFTAIHTIKVDLNKTKIEIDLNITKIKVDQVDI